MKRTDWSLFLFLAATVGFSCCPDLTFKLAEINEIKKKTPKEAEGTKTKSSVEDLIRLRLNPFTDDSHTRSATPCRSCRCSCSLSPSPLSLTFTRLISLHASQRGKYQSAGCNAAASGTANSAGTAESPLLCAASVPPSRLVRCHGQLSNKVAARLYFFYFKYA